MKVAFRNIIRILNSFFSNQKDKSKDRQDEKVPNKQKLDELFKKIGKITGIKDIGYHQINQGKLNPVYKTKVGKITLEEWKGQHKQNPVYIKQNPILMDITTKKETIVIPDTMCDERSTKDVTLFGINSLLMFPVIKNSQVIGVIPVVSIKEKCQFSKEKVKQCEELVEEYKEFLVF